LAINFSLLLRKNRGKEKNFSHPKGAAPACEIFVEIPDAFG
jgi:hypothetical protein